MSIYSSFYDAIRDKIALSEVASGYVNLIRKGQEFQALCPFHKEKTASFTLNDQKRFYHCFGCAAHGDVIDFFAKISGHRYRDAALDLAQKYNIPKPDISPEAEKEQERIERLYSLLVTANEFFVQSMPAEAKKYLYDRHITQEIIQKYSIGFAPYSYNREDNLLKYLTSRNFGLHEILDSGLIRKSMGRSDDNNPDDVDTIKAGDIYEVFRNRITIPIRDHFGKIIAFGGRSIRGEMPKYLNSPETILFKKQEVLYGLDMAIAAACRKNRMILVEGYFDVIAMQCHGFPETVAVMGTAIGAYRIKKLFSYVDEIICCMDGDSAGKRATLKMLDIALPYITPTKKISIMSMPHSLNGDALDPDEVIHHSNYNMEDIVATKKYTSEFIWQTLTEKRKLASPEDKALLDEELNAYVEKIANLNLKKYVSSYFRNQMWQLNSWSKVSKSSKEHISSIGDISNITTIGSMNLSPIDNIEYVMVAVFFLHFYDEIFEEQSSLLHVILDVQEHNMRLQDTIQSLISDAVATNKNTLLMHIDNNGISNDPVLSSILSMYNTSVKMLFSKHDPGVIMDFLIAKRYLIYITQEYRTAMENEIDDNKVNFFIREIQSTTKKVERYNELFCMG